MADRGIETKREIDIEFKDLLWEFLRRWRIFIVLAVVCGILFAAVQYRSDYVKANTPPAQKTTAEEAKGNLTLQESEAVIGAVALKAQIDSKSRYLDESILMNTNPFAQDVVTFQYQVTAIGDASNTAVAAYKSYITSGSIAKNISEAGSQLAQPYIAELITIVPDNQETNLFTIQVTYSDPEGCLALSKQVQQAIDKYEITLNGNGLNHQVALLDTAQSQIVNEELSALMTTYAIDISTNQAKLNSIKNEMTGNQIIVFNDEVEKSLQLEETEEEVSGTPAKVSISKKQILLGIVIGLVLAALYIFVSYLASARLRAKEEIRTVYHTRLLGTVSAHSYGKTPLFGGVDRFIAGLEHKGKKQLDFKQEIRMIVSGLSILCKKNSLEKIYLSGSEIEHIPGAVMTALYDGLQEQGITLISGASLAYDAQALLEASQTGAVVFVEEKRISLYDEILKELQLCGENQITILGVILLND